MLQFTAKLVSILNTLTAGWSPQSPPSDDACTSLATTLSLTNTTIIAAEHITGGQNITAASACQSSAFVTSDICRVYGVVNTTAASAVHFEMWLPYEADAWFGRLLAIGNGGLAGCIDYSTLDYGNTLHFAAVASDNGHDGSEGNGIPFLNHPEVVNDFAVRAVHVEAVLGKEIVHAYYGRAHDKAYFIGCSTGGRQGVQSALLYPDDFDGIIAGAPATDFNHLLGWEAMMGRFVGAPSPGEIGDGFGEVERKSGSGGFIPAWLWPVVSREILRQCDALDGLVDGIITEPDECVFRPEALLCDVADDGGDQSACLTPLQVAALNQIYQPLFGTSGQLLFPRYDPGSEADGNFAALLGGSFFPIPDNWYRYAVYNDSNYSLDGFTVSDIEFADTINPGGISTWNGNLLEFRERGGKIISYHGRRDPLIPSGNSKRLYNLISSTLSKRTLDDFYRLFLVPGMDHCAGGPGAWAFGQFMDAATLHRNDSAHNMLLALVEWVEEGTAPAVIVGTTVGGAERIHCRYPERSVFNGTVFVCEE